MTVLKTATAPGSGTGKAGLPVFFSAILVLAVLGAYHNVINGPFLFDDFNNIVNNPSIRIDALDAEGFSRVFSDEHPTRNRPVANLSFALNYLVGGEDPAGYHLVNILIHILAALALFRLFHLYLRETAHEGITAISLAFGASLLWALNPMQTNAVTYIVQRMTSLCSLFMVLSLLMYFQGRSLSVRQDGSRYGTRIRVFFVLGLLSWCAALLTKEIAVILPVIVLVHEWFFFGGSSLAAVKKNRWPYLLLATVPAVLALLHIGPEMLADLFDGYDSRDFTMIERLLTESRVVVQYLSLFLAPLPSRLTLYYDYPLSHSLFSPPSTFFSIIMIALLLAGSVLYARRYVLIAFGVLWTLIALVVESTVLPLEIIFEHRFYFPSMGFSLALVYAGYRVLHHLRAKAVLLPLLLVLMGAAMGTLTYVRNETWKDEIDFNVDSVAKAPFSVRSNVGLALAYLHAGEWEKGREWLEKAYELDREDVVVLSNLFQFHSSFNARERASAYLSELQESIRAGRFTCNQANALEPVARTLFMQQRYPDALLLLETLTRCRVPAVVYQNLAICYQEIGNYVKARENFETALRLKPGYPYYLYRLAYLYHLEGDRENAIRLLHRLKQGTPPVKSEPFIRDLESVLAPGQG